MNRAIIADENPIYTLATQQQILDKIEPIDSAELSATDEIAGMTGGGWPIFHDDKPSAPSVCAGCARAFADDATDSTANPDPAVVPCPTAILHISTDRYWHAACLKCTKCAEPMAAQPSCMLKQDNVYCKLCYNSEFGVRCARCQRVIAATDWVRRARQLTYHLACFACDMCKRQLSTGEHFALQQRSKLLCKQHYMELIEGDNGDAKGKCKRVRTTFSDDQLAVLQANFQLDSNPDGQDLERIAQMTGLSKRVTQVWFQNSRARQKKYQIKGCEGSDSETPSAANDGNQRAFSTTYSDDDMQSMDESSNPPFPRAQILFNSSADYSQ